MQTLTKKDLKRVAKRIEAATFETNFDKGDGHKMAIQIKLPSWLSPKDISEHGPDRQAFEKKVKQVLHLSARASGYNIRKMDERLPEAAHNIMDNSLKYTFVCEGGKGVLTPVR